MKNKALQGYTLLELSIVLVIIGVIIGAIMLGKTLLVSSKLQTVLTDADSYITAANNFRQTYQALPGDFTNAQSEWGVNTSGCPSAVGGGTSGTCNGNGTGQIGASNDTKNTPFLFWQHLYLAKMIMLPLNGANGPNGGSNGAPPFDAVPSVNVPTGAIKGSGYSVQWAGFVATAGADSEAMLFPGSYGNMLIFGGLNRGYPTDSPILTVDQAASLDAKIDDGFPVTGNVRAPISTYTAFGTTSATNCTTGTSTSSTYYLINASSPNCLLVFVTGW